jgi:hypothetical protein
MWLMAITNVVVARLTLTSGSGGISRMAKKPSIVPLIKSYFFFLNTSIHEQPPLHKYTATCNISFGINTPSLGTDVINLVISSKGKKLPNNPSLGFGLTLGPKINMWPDAWLRLFRKNAKSCPSSAAGQKL